MDTIETVMSDSSKRVELALELVRWEEGGRKTWEGSLNHIQVKFGVSADRAQTAIQSLIRSGLIELHQSRDWTVIYPDGGVDEERYRQIGAGPNLMGHFDQQGT